MEKDTLRRFIIENADVRGEWVHLDDSWQHLLERAEYPATVKKVLGEALAAVSLLSATIKYQGSLIMQVNGTGSVPLLVVQSTSERTVRGLARWNGEVTGESLQDIFGQGHIVITVEPSDGGERYQGVVALQGENLSESLVSYFEQSEQLKTQLWLTADEKSAAGMLLQRLPSETSEEGWEHVTTLAETLTDKELLELDSETILRRLYHQEDVRLFEQEAIAFKCGCSQAKVEGMVKSLGHDDARNLVKEQGNITVDCEFCNAQYVLDSVDVEALFAEQSIEGSESVH